MDITKLDVFSALKTRMSWLGERQKVLAQNVANADTPGYRAQDLKPLDFGDLVADARSGRAGEAGMKRTDPRHFSGVEVAGTPLAKGRPDTDETWEINPTGNSVVLEEQMMKVSQTVMDYQTATNLYAKSVGMIRKALGGGGR